MNISQVQNFSTDDYLQLHINILEKVLKVQKVSGKIALYSLPAIVFFGSLHLIAKRFESKTNVDRGHNCFHKSTRIATYASAGILWFSTFVFIVSSGEILDWQRKSHGSKQPLK